MDCDLLSSYSYSTQYEKELSSDLSSDEWSHNSPQRNQRKRFWKGGEYETINEILMNQNERKIKKTNEEEIKSSCAFVKKRVRNTERNPYHTNQTTIKLFNVPPKMNNILDLYYCFSPFGIITLIQAQRKNNPMSAILSFQTPEEAFKAMENVNKVISNVKAVWFADICLLNSSNNYEQSLENLITDLIRKKSELLSYQLDFLREIMKKINKYKVGSEEERILLELLKRVQDQIYENRKSIEYSVRQKTEYFSKKKKKSPRRPQRIRSACPPWIIALKSEKQEEKSPQNYRRFITHISNRNDSSDGMSSPSSRVLFNDQKSSVNHTSYSQMYKRIDTNSKKKIYARLDTFKDERYVYELDCLLSDSSNDHEMNYNS